MPHKNPNENIATKCCSPSLRYSYYAPSIRVCNFVITVVIQRTSQPPCVSTLSPQSLLPSEYFPATLSSFSKWFRPPLNDFRYATSSSFIPRRRDAMMTTTGWTSSPLLFISLPIRFNARQTWPPQQLTVHCLSADKWKVPVNWMGWSYKNF